MELVSFAKEVLQNIAEKAAGYRIGQTVLRHLDRTLWVLEKCARWAVPPPLDQDERPQPELVRPLPWVFFLMLLVILRVTRESISLVNLVMGRPPLRSADVVMYIQSKRRYLRTLKYQGNRQMRARTSSAQPQEPWFSSLQSLFDFTMCFRRQSLNYGNNNSTSVSNNDEVLVVKRSKRGRQNSSPVASTSETTMERLIEKMMVDLDADSDEDSSYTLTNATSQKSDRSELAESDQDTVFQNKTSTKSNDSAVVVTSTPEIEGQNPLTNDEDIHFSQNNEITSSTPEKVAESNGNGDIGDVKRAKETTPPAPEVPEKKSPKEQSQSFIQHEKTPQKNQRSPKYEKIANGRSTKSVPPKKKGGHNERRDTTFVKSASANNLS